MMWSSHLRFAFNIAVSFSIARCLHTRLVNIEDRLRDVCAKLPDD